MEFLSLSNRELQDQEIIYFESDWLMEMSLQNRFYDTEVS